MENQSLETIELSIKHAKQNVELMRSLDKLTKNKDFKAIFLEGYFEKEPARLCMLKSNPEMQSEDDQLAIVKQIDAIGALRQYFIAINQIGRMSEKAISEDEQTREEILSEGLSE